MAEDTVKKNADYPDWVQEAEEQMKQEAKETVAGKDSAGAERNASHPEEKKEVAIKFGKGLVGDPFTSKSGHQLVEVKIPNANPKDRTPWASFVISPKMIHDNRFGKGVWMKLPEDRKTRIKKPLMIGVDPQGKHVWEDYFKDVPNTELKSMMESYKTRNHEKSSVLGALQEKKEEAASEPKTEKTQKPKEKGIAK